MHASARVQVGKMQAQLHRQALNTVLALTQPKKAKQAQTQSQKQSDMGGLVRDIVAANPSLLYAAEQGRGASQVVVSATREHPVYAMHVYMLLHN